MSTRTIIPLWIVFKKNQIER
eukprot:UN08202